VIRIGVLVAETGGMVGLAPDLRGPVGLQLARAVERPPGEHGMPGDSRYELKWDGFRAAIVRRGDSARIWSRQRKDLTAQFPDIAAAAAKLPDGVVLDGVI
jgi:ATP-dependent DNA ligase